MSDMRCRCTRAEAPPTPQRWALRDGSPPVAPAHRTGARPGLPVVLLVGVLTVLAGCQVTEPRRGPGQYLDTWTRVVLLPGLQETLARSPRFRGQRFAVVRMTEGRLEGRIDGLTLRLRSEITDALAGLPGVRLPGAPDAADPFHRRRWTPDCAPPHHADYFIGIETQAEAEGVHRVTVRIFDTHESQWVSGVRYSWAGRLRPAELAALRETRADPLLRGVRELPFGPDEADLAAAHFANSLSCLLAREGLSEARVYLVRPRHAPEPIRTMAAILDNVLARMQRVTVVRDPKRATHRLVLEWHRLGADLVQVWVSVETQRRTVAGIDTAAYLRLTPSRQTMTASTAGRRTRPSAPGGPSHPRVRSLEIVHTPLHARCDAPVGRAGSGLRPETPVIPGACLGARVQTAGSPASVLLVQLTPQGRILRLEPTHCRVPGSTAVALNAAWREGMGAVYALALAADVPSALLEHLRRLPEPCTADTPAVWTADQARRWASRLDALLANAEGRVDWVVRRIRYRSVEG